MEKTNPAPTRHGEQLQSNWLILFCNWVKVQQKWKWKLFLVAVNEVGWCECRCKSVVLFSPREVTGSSFLFTKEIWWHCTPFVSLHHLIFTENWLRTAGNFLFYLPVPNSSSTLVGLGFVDLNLGRRTIWDNNSKRQDLDLGSHRKIFSNWQLCFAIITLSSGLGKLSTAP